MGKAGRAVLLSAYFLASVVVFYAAIADRLDQGEHGSLTGGWAMSGLFVASVAIGAFIGRVWTALAPFVVLAILLPIAFLSADGHALANLIVGLPTFAIVLAGAVALGLAARRLVGRFAGRP